MRDDRIKQFQEVKTRIDEPKASNRLKISFYKMIILESAMNLNLGYMISSYVCEKDDSASAVLSSSPFKLKDVAKLYNWVTSLKKHLEEQIKGYLLQCVVPVMTRRDRQSEKINQRVIFDLEKILKLTLSISTVVTALIYRKQVEINEVESSNSQSVEVETVLEAASR